MRRVNGHKGKLLNLTRMSGGGREYLSYLILNGILISAVLTLPYSCIINEIRMAKFATLANVINVLNGGNETLEKNEQKRVTLFTRAHTKNKWNMTRRFKH